MREKFAFSITARPERPLGVSREGEPRRLKRVVGGYSGSRAGEGRLLAKGARLGRAGSLFYWNKQLLCLISSSPSSFSFLSLHFPILFATAFPVLLLEDVVTLEWLSAINFESTTILLILQPLLKLKITFKPLLSPSFLLQTPFTSSV